MATMIPKVHDAITEPGTYFCLWDDSEQSWHNRYVPAKDDPDYRETCEYETDLMLHHGLRWYGPIELGE